MNKLDNRVAVVVDDGDTAVREAVIEALLAEGAEVVVAGESGNGHQRLTSHGGRLLGRDEIEALLAFTVERFGRVDVVVLPVGDPEDTALADLDAASWAAATNQLDRVLWGVRASLLHMVPRQQGRVVVTMGAEAKVGRLGAAVATAVGHAAYGIVKVAAKEGGPHGVTVNAVLGTSRGDPSLTGRNTEPAEVAAAVLLLASEAGGGMSGVAFPVDCGVSPY